MSVYERNGHWWYDFFVDGERFRRPCGKTGVTHRSGVRYKLSEVIAWENARTVEPVDINNEVEGAFERHVAGAR